ncbi:uncharacterized protein LOC128963216 [Oppia nitens]|uniref:uncharacterized protein LOC128963216 n=1 Tax=Oppia nitens TaxID=1686743 RepID=UPI0023DAE1D6|nr:uncharacterized protein LOC128963216 [Oppia nitens]
MIFNSLKQLPNSIQIIDSDTGRHTSKHQVLDYGLRFATFLIDEYHINTGDVCLFTAKNCDIHGIALIGVIFSGAIYACIPDHSTVRELQEVIRQIKPTVLVIDTEKYDVMSKIASKFNLKLLVLEQHVKHLSIENIFITDRQINPILPVETSWETTITFVMSSGTTGRPKAIRRTNGNHLATVAMFKHRELLPMTENDVLLSTAFLHICGQRCLFSAIESGARVLALSCDESHGEVFEAINKYGVTHAILMPTQLNYLVKHPDQYPANYFSNLRDVLTGAAPLAFGTHQAIKERYNFEKFCNSYGMSESGFVLTVHLHEKDNLSDCETVGKVNPGSEIMVIDTNGNSLGPGKLGEICIKGDQVTPGYVNNAKENEKLFTPEGFLKSGDIGYYDCNHFFYIVGRSKQMIKVDGVSISPVELEHLLISHKDVENAAVVGISDDERGEVPMAFVTVIEGAYVTEEQLIEFVDSQVNDHKKLRGGLRILESFPTTPSGKIHKSKLNTDNPFFH